MAPAAVSGCWAAAFTMCAVQQQTKYALRQGRSLLLDMPAEDAFEKHQKLLAPVIATGMGQVLLQRINQLLAGWPQHTLEQV